MAHDTDPSSLRATLADRDNLDQEDTVTIFLDTFSDQRRAFFFTVNALGVQQDGVQSEGTFNAGMIRGGPQADKNPDRSVEIAQRRSPALTVCQALPPACARPTRAPTRRRLSRISRRVTRWSARASRR